MTTGRTGPLEGTTIGIDATTLEANAGLRSIVRRDTGRISGRWSMKGMMREDT
jgi:hypothetical protein